MNPEILSRTLSREEGLKIAYQYFNDEKVIEAAAMFCIYNDPDNDLQISTETEVQAMANELHEMMTSHSLVELIKSGLVIPSLDQDNKICFSINKQ